jgi:hypothetical protein
MKEQTREVIDFLILLITGIVLLLLFTDCTPTISGTKGQLSVTGGISGTAHTTDGKDMNYDLHGTYVAPRQPDNAP